MSYNINDLFVARNSRSGYQIEQSLRFSTDEYLTRTNSTASTDGQYGTLSVWYKMDSTTASSQLRTIIAGENSTYGHFFRFYLGKTDLHIGVWGSIDGGAYSSADFRDDSAWYHFLWQFDKTQSGVTNVNKLWVNNVAQSETSAGNFSSQNWGITNNGSTVRIGHYQGNGSTQYARLKGYIAEMHVVDGALKSATDFGEYDDNGVWRPIKYTGTYGNNGFYLKFDPSATNGIGHDHSGNGNNFTANNFITSGTGTDVMSDTPTTNWATLNPLWNPIQATYAEGNLQFTGGATHSPSVSSISASSGKFYFEATALSGSATKWSLGIIDTAIEYRKISGTNYIPGYVPSGIYSLGDAISLYDNNIYKNGSSIVSSVFSGGAVAAGDVVQMAVDIDAGKIWFGIDGTWNNGGGTEGAFDSSGHDATFAANDNYIFHFTAESCGWTVNFGQRDFSYTPPTGFKALNTSNLSAPDIADGSQYFNPVLYAPNGSSSFAVTGVGFQPDFVWVKSRNYAEDHQLNDAVRGATKGLQTNLTNAQITQSNGLTSFDSDGFTVGNLSDYNYNGDSIISWNWKANGSGSSNSGGSLVSTVSANPSAGFSIVTYEGVPTTGTVPHGLGVVPAMIIVKSYLDGENWYVWHQNFPNTSADYFTMNSYNAKATATNLWNNTAPTSTVFSVGSDSATCGDGYEYVAYCFAEVEGYCKAGKYHGNSDGDGVFVYTGFTPAFIMIKGDVGQDFFISDVKRSPYNVTGKWLRPNLSNAEIDDPNTNGAGHDILSNGFKIRTNTYGLNRDYDYYYIAFASNPFGGSGVSPATAR